MRYVNDYYELKTHFAEILSSHESTPTHVSVSVRPLQWLPQCSLVACCRPPTGIRVSNFTRSNGDYYLLRPGRLGRRAKNGLVWLVTRESRACTACTRRTQRVFIDKYSAHANGVADRKTISFPIPRTIPSRLRLCVEIGITSSNTIFTFNKISSIAYACRNKRIIFHFRRRNTNRYLSSLKFSSNNQPLEQRTGKLLKLPIERLLKTMFFCFTSIVMNCVISCTYVKC